MIERKIDTGRAPRARWKFMVVAHRPHQQCRGSGVHDSRPGDNAAVPLRWLHPKSIDSLFTGVGVHIWTVLNLVQLYSHLK